MEKTMSCELKRNNHYILIDTKPLVWWYTDTRFRITYNQTLQKWCVKLGSSYLDKDALKLMLKELLRQERINKLIR